jgi:DMSO/TMAO reductase YedYZ molybdopterin-dependent catalytic subunit
MISRRDFLKDVSLAALAAGAASPLSWAASEQGVVVPGKEGMIVRSFRFLDLEMPDSAFDSWLTPLPHFFVRNHMHMPSTLEVEEYRLSVGGAVERTLNLRLAELKALPQHTVVNTLECAGNGRGLQRPRVPGVQWEKGAVGTARFHGPRLKDVLEKAGVKSSGKHVLFRGRDEVPGKVPPFLRSIPIEKAMHPDTLLATHMNGTPLPKYHGRPLRALVPGWIGAASIKWLAEITVLDKEFDGNFMKPGYRMPRSPVAPGGEVKPEDTDPVTALRVKSVIASPQDGAKTRLGPVKLSGAAWAGAADIVRVEISADSGATWHAAELAAEKARYAWRLWRYMWKPAKAGDYVLMARATDSQGHTQPVTPDWNPSGYLYNAVDQVRIHVES